MEVMNVLAKETAAHWASLAPLFSIRNEREYDRAVKRLNELVDAVGDDEQHPLYGLLDALGAVVHSYEQQHVPMPPVKGRHVLRHLMEAHGLKQADVPEIGSQGIVSEVLSGKRELNARQIAALATRFHVSPAVFF